MKKLVCLTLLASACSGGKYHAPPAVPQIAMPAGSQLKPFDASKPGAPHPEGLAELNGKTYVALSNTRAGPDDYGPGGPGFVAAIVPGTGEVTLIDLGGSDGKQCQNPGALAVAGGNLYVACGGAYDGTGAAIVELSGDGVVTRAVPVSIMPYTLTAAASKLWVGDAFSDTVLSIDRTSFALTSDHLVLGCPKGSSANGNFPYSLVADLELVDGDLYALCGADVGGQSTVSRLDVTTGAVKQTVDVGPLPAALAPLDDGRVAVINAGDNTLMFLTPGASALTAQTAMTFNSQTQTLSDLRSRDGFLYTVASGSNTVQKIDPNAQGGVKVVAEVNVGQGANPWNILQLDDDQALVTNWVAGDVVAVKW